MTFHTFGRSDLKVRAHPELDAWIVRRILAGAHPKAIAAASGGAISLRTAYRWRHVTGIEEVRVGDHVATFVLRSGQAPTRITPWEHKPTSARVSKRLGGIRCGLWMPVARARCARFAGHKSQCNSPEHLENNARHAKAQRDQRRRQRQAAA